MASDAITIFEGLSDYGKTTIAHAILQGLETQCTRMSLSLTKSMEHSFGWNISQFAPEGGLVMAFLEVMQTVTSRRCRHMQSCWTKSTLHGPGSSSLLMYFGFAWFGS
jgi:hypothetical protein